MRYKVGDKVRVRQWDDMKREFGELYSNISTPFYFFVTSMMVYCGLICEIIGVEHGYYKLKSNEEQNIEKWKFTDDMLEGVASPSLETPKMKKESKKKMKKQKTQRERLKEQLDTYQRDSEVKAIDIIVPEKIVKVTMNDCLGTALITKCHKDDTFSLEKAIIVAYVKYSIGNLTSEGIEYETERFSHYKTNVKKLKKAMKVYETQQKLKALDEEEERIRANKKRKKIAQKKRRAERLAEEKLKETKEAAKIYAEELKSVLAGYDIPVETTDKIVKDMNVRM